MSYKVILVGDSGVGKSSLVNRWIQGTFEVNMSQTIGAAFFCQHISIENQQVVKLHIWDTAGQERFHSLTPMYLKGAHIALLCFEFPDMQYLLRHIRNIRIANDKVHIMLIATKIDNPENDKSFSPVIQYAEKHNLPLFYTSAYTGRGVNEVFFVAATHCYENFLEELSNSMILIDNQSVKDSSCPC